MSLPNVFIGGPGLFRLDSRLMHAGMTGSLFEESGLLQALQRAVVIEFFRLRFGRPRIGCDREVHHIDDRFARHQQIRRQMFGKGLVGFLNLSLSCTRVYFPVILFASASLDFIKRVAS